MRYRIKLMYKSLLMYYFITKTIWIKISMTWIKVSISKVFRIKPNVVIATVVTVIIIVIVIHHLHSISVCGNFVVFTIFENECEETIPFTFTRKIPIFVGAVGKTWPGQRKPQFQSEMGFVGNSNQFLYWGRGEGFPIVSMRRSLSLHKKNCRPLHLCTFCYF